MSKYALTCFMSLVMALGVARADRLQVPLAEPPPRVRLTGVLLPPRQGAAEAFPSLDVRVGETRWTLHVRDVESVTTDDPPGWPLLRRVRPFLTIRGPADLTGRLRRAAEKEEQFVLEGRLYAGERALVLTDVRPAG